MLHMANIRKIPSEPRTIWLIVDKKFPRKKPRYANKSSIWALSSPKDSGGISPDRKQAVPGLRAPRSADN